MKSILENIAANLSVPSPANVLIQLWGNASQAEDLELFIKLLEPKHTCVKGILFDSEAMVQACEKGPYDIGHHISEDEISQTQVVIDLCCYSPTGLIQEMSDQAKPNFIAFMRRHFALISAPGKQFLQVRLPSRINAEESGMSLEDYTDVFKRLSSATQTDLEAICTQRCVDLEKTIAVSIQTSEEHTLSLSYANRPWYSDHGDGDFPAGEVYIAPIENSAEGTFKADLIFWEGEHFKDVVLTFEAGVLSECSVPHLLDDLSHTGPGALTIAEFGLGLNPKLDFLTGHSLFDEKIDGSCHIAVGMNHLFGGQTECGVHVDFVSKHPKLIFS